MITAMNLACLHIWAAAQASTAIFFLRKGLKSTKTINTPLNLELPGKKCLEQELTANYNIV